METMCFLGLYLMIIYGLNTTYISEIFDLLKKYILIFYPILTFVSLQTNDKIVYSDEFGIFWGCSIIPLLAFTIKGKERLLHLIIALILFAAKTVTGHIGSFEFIAIILSAFFVFLKTIKLKTVLITVTVFIAFIPISYNLIDNYGNEFAKMKVRQVKLSFELLSEAISKQDKTIINKLPFSPQVRIKELLNIVDDMKEKSTLILLTGKGYGSYFEDKYMPFDIAQLIRAKDAYPKEQILKRKFKTPHNSPFYIPLKIGFLGLFYFIILNIYLYFLKPIKEYYWFQISIISFIIVVFGYTFKNFIFIGLFIGIILNLSQKKGKII
jgi:hypothetical protein